MKEAMANDAILLVEDNPDDEVLALRALMQNKIANRVDVAHDGVEALTYLFGDDSREAQPLPQVVLLDLKLPRIDGLEVLRAIRADQRTRLLPVVVLTSSSEEKDLVESYSLGANSYIIKPVDFTQFSEAVGRLGMYWLVLNQTPRTNRTP
jgi:two-component system, response regulator